MNRDPTSYLPVYVRCILVPPLGFQFFHYLVNLIFDLDVHSHWEHFGLLGVCTPVGFASNQ